MKKLEDEKSFNSKSVKSFLSNKTNRSGSKKSEEKEEERCSICLEFQRNSKAPLHHCEGCFSLYHQKCYNKLSENIKKNNSDLSIQEKFCCKCIEQQNLIITKKEEGKIQCFICNEAEGIIFRNSNEQFVHYYCQLFFKELQENKQIAKIRFNYKCRRCGHNTKDSPGIHCHIRGCKKGYHIKCAIEDGLIFNINWMRTYQASQRKPDQDGEDSSGKYLMLYCKVHNKEMRKAYEADIKNGYKESDDRDDKILIRKNEEEIMSHDEKGDSETNNKGMIFSAQKVDRKKTESEEGKNVEQVNNSVNIVSNSVISGGNNINTVSQVGNINLNNPNNSAAQMIKNKFSTTKVKEKKEKKTTKKDSTPKRKRRTKKELLETDQNNQEKEQQNLLEKETPPKKKERKNAKQSKKELNKELNNPNPTINVQTNLNNNNNVKNENDNNIKSDNEIVENNNGAVSSPTENKSPADDEHQLQQVSNPSPSTSNNLNVLNSFEIIENTINHDKNNEIINIKTDKINTEKANNIDKKMEIDSEAENNNINHHPTEIAQNTLNNTALNNSVQSTTILHNQSAAILPGVNTLTNLILTNNANNHPNIFQNIPQNATQIPSNSPSLQFNTRKPPINTAEQLNTFNINKPQTQINPQSIQNSQPYKPFSISSSPDSSNIPKINPPQNEIFNYNIIPKIKNKEELLRLREEDYKRRAEGAANATDLFEAFKIMNKDCLPPSAFIKTIYY